MTILALAALLLQAPAATVATLDSAFGGLRAGPPAPAAAIMVSYRGRIVYRNVAGYADLEHRVPATLDTRFDVASIAKQFTGFAVSRLVTEGKLAPADRADRFLHELDLGGAKVTIEQLLHHTAGVEDADGLMVLAGWLPGGETPFADVVRLLCSQQHLRFPPGERHFYSNGGYVLLAEIVRRVSGTSFHRYLDSTVFRPLGMTSTAFLNDSGDIVPDLALPYERDRAGRLRTSRIDRYPGAGGLVTTVGDLTRWAEHLMRPRRDSAATLRLREPGRLNSGEPVRYGWGIAPGELRGQAMLAHAGSGPATEAQLIVLPDLDFAVVAVAAGPTGLNPSTLARNAIEAFVGNRLGPPETPGRTRMIMITDEELNRRPAESMGVTVPADRLPLLAGTYRMSDDSSRLVIRVRDGGLEYAMEGRAPFRPLFPLADGRFVTVPLWDVYRFTPAAGPATGLVRETVARSLRRGGPDVPGERLPDPVPLDSAAAAPYLGWYVSDETGAAFRVGFRNGGLFLAHARLGEFPLMPRDGERFSIDSRLVASARFGRVGSRVVGLELEAFSWSVTGSFRKIE
ncbi:MAG: serine hydrolase domain-containing protein [Gemmatimonadales bacterium]